MASAHRDPAVASPLPRWLWLPAMLALAVLALPLVGLVARVPWPQLPDILTTQATQDALWLSLRTCVASTTVAVVLGLPLALWLSRLRGRAAVLVRTVALLPMVLPPVVAGVVLLATFGRRGLIGGPLASVGIELGFTTTAVVMAQSFVAMPFFVVAVEGALRSLDHEAELVAATLGASPGVVLRRVTVPMLAPALGNGAALAFARALGEFGATLTFAGSLQGTTRTLPLEIYLVRESSTESALAVSLLLVTLALVVVLVATWVGKRGWGRP